MSKFVKCSELPRKPIWNLRGFMKAGGKIKWEGEEEGKEEKVLDWPEGVFPRRAIVSRNGFKEVSL